MPHGFPSSVSAAITGYARVSTDDQNLDPQRDVLTRAGCTRLYEDRISGAKAARPGLALALEVARVAISSSYSSSIGSVAQCRIRLKQCASVAPPISDNMRRERSMIARRAVHLCASLQLVN